MTSISGTIRIGEAQATCAATARRQRGATWGYITLMLAMWFGCAIIGYLVGDFIAYLDKWLTAFAGALFGLAAYQVLVRRLVVLRFRRRLIGVGTPLDMPAVLTLTDEALVNRVADIEKRAAWRAVSEIFYAKGYWIFMVQSEPWFAPDHFFVSDADKRAFLAQALSHMSDEARARSPAAVRVAEGRA